MRFAVLLSLVWLSVSSPAAGQTETGAESEPATETAAQVDAGGTTSELGPVPPPPPVPAPPAAPAATPSAMSGATPGVTPSATAPRPVTAQPWSPPRYGPRVTLRRDRGETLWLPQLSWGFASTVAPGGDGGLGSRVQLTIPVWIVGERGARVRFTPLVGYSWMRGHPGREERYFGSSARIDSDVPYFHRHHALFGAAVRVGGKQVAWQTELFWSPGTFGSWDCRDHPEPDPDIDYHMLCESSRGPTAASFRIDMGATIWNAFVGWTAEVAWRRGERARSLGIRIGTTFH